MICILILTATHHYEDSQPHANTFCLQNNPLTKEI